MRSLPLTAGSTIMILSPHLDDSVLSCGGLMTDAHRRGVRVIVITVFNGQANSPRVGSGGQVPCPMRPH